jgi:hypothetical protein
VFRCRYISHGAIPPYILGHGDDPTRKATRPGAHGRQHTALEEGLVAQDRRTVRRNKKLLCRLSEREEQLLERAASDAGVPVSDMVRWGLRLAITATPRPREP